MWDKQLKSPRCCLDKFALERSRGKSDFPKGHSPKGKSDYPRDLPWANLPDNAQGFSTVSQAAGFKNRRGFRLSLGTVSVLKAQTFPKEQPGETAKVCTAKFKSSVFESWSVRLPCSPRTGTWDSGHDRTPPRSAHTPRLNYCQFTTTRESCSPQYKLWTNLGSLSQFGIFHEKV